MGIKRWKLYSDYGDSAMCETGNQPAGHWHPVSEDDYVLYTDYAALKVKLEIAQQLKVAIEDDANRTEAALKARVEELTLKGKEREQIAVDDAELIQTLRAQLEAAKAQLTAQPDGVRALLQAWVDWYAQGSGPQFKTPPYSQSVQALAAAPAPDEVKP